jgi:hypothetical protein
MRPDRLTQACRLLLAAGILVGPAGTSEALQRTVPAKPAKYDEAPVVVRQASVRLVETYSAPTQYPLATSPEGYEIRVKRSRVRYANRANQQVPTYLLEGHVEVANETRRPVEAMQITTVFVNAFGERIGTDRSSIAQGLAPRKSRRIDWSKSLPHHEVFEVYFVVTAVRFADGEVWTPTEELILLP